MKKITILTASAFFITNLWASEQQCLEQANTIESKLDCLSNISDVTEVKDNKYLPADMRQFEMNIEQLVNKEKPGLGTFKQKLVLLHRDESEPMVLQTSGYEIYWVAPTAITKVFQTNQLQIEHRFFADSTPDSKDWSQLNIKQSADDFHVVTETFKKIYTQPWVGTGASKGGMTSTYHRFFYPHDLVGTVADVAPLSFSTADQRYSQFINSVGGLEYADCRKAWADMQVALLSNRDLFIPRYQGDFSRLGGVDIAFEHAILESVFSFWQYGNADDPKTGCPAIPKNGNIQDIYDFVFNHISLTYFENSGIEMFEPYYYQAATELGAPDSPTSHLEPYRWFNYDINQYVPQYISLNYSNAHMHAIDKWIRNYAENIMFIYGEFDPWTAGEYPMSETGKSIFKYFVPKGNHGAKFTELSSEELEKAMAILSKWLGKNPLVNEQGQAIKSNIELKRNLDKEIYLEDLEFELRKQNKLL